jgi:hypothetical protein
MNLLLDLQFKRFLIMSEPWKPDWHDFAIFLSGHVSSTSFTRFYLAPFAEGKEIRLPEK